MDAQPQSSPSARTRRPSGREAKRAARAARRTPSMPYITRKIGVYEVLDEEGLATDRAQCRHDPRGDRHRVPRRPGGARRSGKAAGADDRGRARALSRAACAAASSRRPRRANSSSTRAIRRAASPIGGKHTVFAPAYGSPFVRNLDEGRRYATIEDFRNFVKLAYMATVAAPLRRHDLRAGRPAGEQAASRHGVQPHEVQRQAVHGLGHAPGARAGLRRDGEDPVRRPSTSIRRPASRRR